MARDRTDVATNEAGVPLHMVRGKPGMWVPPVTLPWPMIQDVAAGDCYPLSRLSDLPPYNRNRVGRGYPPLALKSWPERHDAA